MWLYYLLKAISTFVSWLPYKLVVIIGKGLGRIYHKVAKKQRVRAEITIKERLGYDDKQAYDTIRQVFIKLAITFMEMLYMPALNKKNIHKVKKFLFPFFPIKTFRSTRLLLVLAILIALRVVLGFINIKIAPFALTISIAWIPVMLIGWYFGPVIGLTMG